MKRIAVLASGSGSNLQALIDQIHEKDGEIVLVLSDKEEAYALKRAEKAGISGEYISPEGLNDEAYNRLLIQRLQEVQPDLIVLAGYMKIVTKDFVEAFDGNIINIHPSLIPSFCGPGYFGLRVHRAVLDYGVKVSGASVHFVNEEADQGPIIAQRAVEVFDDDTPESLQKRILETVEHVLLPEVTRAICQDRVSRQGRKVTIDTR